MVEEKKKKKKKEEEEEEEEEEGGHNRRERDTVNKINYAKCPGAHQSRGNNVRVRVLHPHGLYAFLPVTDN